jgi:hypothetical protein
MSRRWAVSSNSLGLQEQLGPEALRLPLTPYRPASFLPFPEDEQRRPYPLVPSSVTQCAYEQAFLRLSSLHPYPFPIVGGIV